MISLKTTLSAVAFLFAMTLPAAAHDDLTFGGKNVKVTLVYEHELPNVPG